jgi:hypothetical protein
LFGQGIEGGCLVGPWHSPGQRGSNGFEPNSNFKRIQIILKHFKVWTIQKGPSRA